MSDIRCKFLRTKEILDLTGWSRATLHRRVAAGSFPTPAKFAPGSTMLMWPKAVVDRWRQRIEEQGGET